jgi:hypothetical protein
VEEGREVTRPENTSQRDPMIHLLGAMSDGASGYIEGMEAQGQQQLVHSDRLPTKSDGDDRYTALGFAFGTADDRDPMFRPASLPHGWHKQGSDHSMWSYVVDEHGRKRVSIFYKAAFYDRDAFMRLNTVYGYAYEALHEGTTPLFDESWCTAAAFGAALAKIREEREERRDLYADKLNDPRVPWAAEELEKTNRDIAHLDAFARKVGAQ